MLKGIKSEEEKAAFLLQLSAAEGFHLIVTTLFMLAISVGVLGSDLPSYHLNYWTFK